MPNKHAAVKDLRKNKKRAIRNAKLKTHTRSLVKQISALVKDGKKTEAAALIPKAQQALAKAAKNNVYHSNKTARMTSALQRAVATK